MFSAKTKTMAEHMFQNGDKFQNNPKIILILRGLSPQSDIIPRPGTNLKNSIILRSETVFAFREHFSPL